MVIDADQCILLLPLQTCSQGRPCAMLRTLSSPAMMLLCPACCSTQLLVFTQLFYIVWL